MSHLHAQTMSRSICREYDDKLPQVLLVMREICLSFDKDDSSDYELHNVILYGKTFGVAMCLSKSLSKELDCESYKIIPKKTTGSMRSIFGTSLTSKKPIYCDICVKEAVDLAIRSTGESKYKKFYEKIRSAKIFVCPFCKGKDNKNLPSRGIRKFDPTLERTWMGLVMHVTQKHSEEEVDSLIDLQDLRLDLRIKQRKALNFKEGKLQSLLDDICRESLRLEVLKRGFMDD